MNDKPFFLRPSVACPFCPSFRSYGRTLPPLPLDIVEKEFFSWPDVLFHFPLGEGDLFFSFLFRLVDIASPLSCEKARLRLLWTPPFWESPSIGYWSVKQVFPGFSPRRVENAFSFLRRLGHSMSCSLDFRLVPPSLLPKMIAFSPSSPNGRANSSLSGYQPGIARVAFSSPLLE